MTEPPARLFCFGLGFSALALARRLLAAGWQVAGTVRSPEKAEALAAEGIAAFCFDARVDARVDSKAPLDDPPPAALSAALTGATHLLASVPPEAEGDPVLARHGEALAAHAAWRWIGYLSTTGVYGDRDGGWVDEDSDLEPSGERGRRRVAAERAWLALGASIGAPVHLFRLAGIYGPGRSALDTVRGGQARRIDKPSQVFSRIHVEDIARVLEASIARPAAPPGRAYNLCDDEAAPPAEVIAHACALLGVEAPPLVPFEAADLSPMGRSFYRDNKRVSNRRIKEELGVTLAYPDYRQGLAALLDQGF